MICFQCRKTVDLENDFRDEISRREAMISKLCQPCQDVTFDEAYEMATDVPYDEE